MQENLNEMIKALNKKETKIPPSKLGPSSKTEDPVKEPEEEVVNEITITNFYDWYETFSSQVTNVAQVKAEVSNINSKDSIIFKIPKTSDPEMSELVSFYKPATRPVLNLPPIRLKVFKNDTFEVLHAFNENIFIKSYGVKTGLIVVFCVNVDGKVIPFERLKIKKNVTTFVLKNYSNMYNEIKGKLQEEVDSEAITLLYKQAADIKFTTKESTIDWFLKRQSEIIDINHLLKIDNVLINVI